MKDYYYILGIEKDASLEEIKTAYRKLSLKFHPDQNNGDKFFEERFKEINEAYEALMKESIVTCPRCLGKGYVDYNDIKRVFTGTDFLWSPGGCRYCLATGKVHRDIIQMVSVSDRFYNQDLSKLTVEEQVKIRAFDEMFKMKSNSSNTDSDTEPSTPDKQQESKLELNHLLCNYYKILRTLILFQLIAAPCICIIFGIFFSKEGWSDNRLSRANAGLGAGVIIVIVLSFLRIAKFEKYNDILVSGDWPENNNFLKTDNLMKLILLLLQIAFCYFPEFAKFTIGWLYDAIKDIVLPSKNMDIFIFVLCFYFPTILIIIDSWSAKRTL